ncbi:MAG: TRAM domain-containing protein [Candidatus Daviesbacteria bacterium]|nr:TRAM domain-containing protein [Candidatus Daviesbacteria bacterium]
MRLRLVLRLVLAFLFATFAAIFSQLIPPFLGEASFVIRVLLTLAAGGLGYMVFPPVARSVRIITMTSLNFVVHRLLSELSNQIVKIPHSSPSISGTHSQVGSVSMTRPLVLDTSAIIDGRILDIAKTGFVSNLVLVPSFVLTELQQVADSADSLKRARGRKGFETVEELKKLKSIRVEIWDKDQSNKAVDERLLNLAKNLHGRIITTDFNLNKLAVASNISVLNVNDLANAVKTISLPGESMEIKIVHLGKDRSQGVGYLADGTMVVVTDSAEKIGRTVKVEVTKNIQTPAGRMIFAKEVG